MEKVQKPREKQKKNNFPEVLESRKVQNQKNLEKTKKNKKNNIPEVLGRGGGQTFCFLEVFLVLHFSAFQYLWKIVFFFSFLEVFLLKISGKLSGT